MGLIHICSCVERRQNSLILLLIDGIEINELNSGGLQYNLENVKQIEVLYGPASVLYGTNAISGIINIITYSPDDYKTEKSTIGIATGTFNTTIADARTGYIDEQKELGYTFSARYATSEKADLAGIDGDNNRYDTMENFEKTYTLEGKFDYKDFSVGMLYQDKKASRTTTNNKSIGTIYQDYGTLWHISFLNLWLRHEQKINQDINLNSLLYYRDSTVHDDTIAYINTIDGQVAYYCPNSLFGIEEQLNYKISEKTNLTFALQYEQENLSENFSRSLSGDINIEPINPLSPIMLKQDLYSVYLQLQQKVMEKTEVTLGGRYDYMSNSKENIFTPRISIMHHYNDKFSIYSSYAEAYRAPKPWDFTYGDGNSELQSETMQSYELGFNYMLNSSIHTSVVLYHNTIKNKFTKENNRWENSEQLITKGLELTLDYKINKHSVFANYSYNDSKNKDGSIHHGVAKNIANAGFLYSFTNNLKLSTQFNYIGKYTGFKTVTATGTK